MSGIKASEVKVGDRVNLNGSEILVTYNEEITRTIPQWRFIKGIKDNGEMVYYNYTVEKDLLLIASSDMTHENDLIIWQA